MKNRALWLFFLPAFCMSTVALAQTTKPARTTPPAAPSEPASKPNRVAQVQTVLKEMYPPQPTVTFRAGSSAANLGLGFLNGNNGYDIYGSINASPALTGSYEYGLTESIGPGTIGVGGLLGYQSHYYNFPTTGNKAVWRDFLVMGRGTYHYNPTADPNLDVYAGVTLGTRFNSYRNDNSGSSPQPTFDDTGWHFASGIFLGARYYLIQNLGAFAEVGYDITYLKFGLTGRF